MNHPQLPTPTAKGAAAGFLIALIGAFSYELPIWALADIYDTLDFPVMFLAHLPVLLGIDTRWIARTFFYSFHFAYWIVNGALVGWCLGRLRAKT